MKSWLQSTMNESDVYIYIFYGQFGGMFQLAMLGFHLTPVSVGRSDSVAFDSATELRCVFFGSHFQDQSQGCGGRPPNVKKKARKFVSQNTYLILHKLFHQLIATFFEKNQS